MHLLSSSLCKASSDPAAPRSPAPPRVLQPLSQAPAHRSFSGQTRPPSPALAQVRPLPNKQPEPSRPLPPSLHLRSLQVPNTPSHPH